MTKINISNDVDLTLNKKSERNLGVDLLRCVAMIMVVMLHLFNRAGAASAISGNETVKELAVPLRIFLAGCVNIYAIISGYVMLKSKFRLSRIIELWLQVFITGVTLSIVSTIFIPGSIPTSIWVRSFMPITQKEFWYFSAYVGVFMLSPIVNKGILSLTRNQSLALFFGCFFLFSVGTMAGRTYIGDPFSMGSGYSVIWLLVLYIMGACMKQSGFLSKTRKGWLFLAFLVSYNLSWLIDWVLNLKGIPEPIAKLDGLLSNYVSPILTINAVLLLALFSKFEIKNTVASALIRFFAPLTFGVYIIHIHHAFWRPLQGSFRFVKDIPDAAKLPFIIISAVLLFIFFALIDFVRKIIFKLLKIDKFSVFLDKKLHIVWRKLCGAGK